MDAINCLYVGQSVYRNEKIYSSVETFLEALNIHSVKKNRNFNSFWSPKNNTEETLGLISAIHP